MRIHLHQPKFLIQYSEDLRALAVPRSITWNGKDLLALGHPTHYVLQCKGNEIFVRNFTTANEIKSPLQKISLVEANYNQKLSLSLDGRDTLVIRPIKSSAAVDYDQIRQLPRMSLPNEAIPLAEDHLFLKHVKRLGTGALVMFVTIFLFKPAEPELAVNEDLIPQKYAKLIMTKPKETKQAPTQGGSTQSQAQVKAVARAFQSTAVQKSMRNILKGGLSKYSVMSTGRAIQSLSQQVVSKTNIAGAGLQNKASDILAGNRVGTYQIGSDSGYGSGNGVNVKGQGNGQFDVGLITQDAVVDEGLTKEEVAKVIHSHLNEIRYCYESAILKDPTLAGKVLVDFKINAGGIVPSAGIAEDSISDKAVGNCLAGKLRTWKFPQPRGGVVVAVSYPFIFKSLSR
jgi:hypothetical protein